MKEDLISIVIPIYNVEQYLEKCVNIVLKQTYKNIEIILVDDGSPDNCPKICDKYKEKDERIVVIHKKNGGLSDARNAGINIAKGKYITFIDSDDYITNDYIEYLYNLIKKYNTKMSICSYLLEINNKKRIDSGKNYKEEVLSTKECLSRMLCEKGFSVSAWAKMYDINLFKDVKYPVGKLCEDNGTTYKLIMQCENIAFGNECKYIYIKRDGSIMNSKFNMKKLDLIELTDEMCNEIDKKYPDLKEVTFKKIITSRFSILRQMVSTKLNEEQKKEEKQIQEYVKNRKKQILKNKHMDKRDKIALISLLLGKRFFSIAWNVYTKIKY